MELKKHLINMRSISPRPVGVCQTKRLNPSLKIIFPWSYLPLFPHFGTCHLTFPCDFLLKTIKQVWLMMENRKKNRGLHIASGRWCNKNSGIIERSPHKFNLCNSLDSSGEERFYSMPSTCFQASVHQGDSGEALINCSPTLGYLPGFYLNTRACAHTAGRK